MRSLRRRSGFTIVELLVATVLVQVGLLATVAASAVLVRAVRDDESRWVAVQLASDRIERLGTAPCAPVAASAMSAEGVHENWRMTVSSGVREMRDSVSYGPHGARSVVLESRAPC